MKVKEVIIRVIRREAEDLVVNNPSDIQKKNPLRREENELPILTIVTDEGIEGTSFGIDGLRQAYFLKDIKPYLLDEDPLYPEKIWQKLWIRLNRDSYRLPTELLLSPIDIAVWDIVGKAANLPIYKLLGAYRDKIAAYASLFPGSNWNTEAYAEHAQTCKNRGFTAYKLHIASRNINFHIAVCKAVRNAVGDDMVLMHDTAGWFNRYQALKIGRELEKLDYYWFEEPINDIDAKGLKHLSDTLDIPICSLEVITGNIFSRAQYIARGDVDIVRGDTLSIGGITPLKKLASLAEAFNINCEIHRSPNPLAEAANMHVMCSIKNCEYFEWAVPENYFGVKEYLKLDSQGYVYAPQMPGLGLEIDWEYIDSHTIATF